MFLKIESIPPDPSPLIWETDASQPGYELTDWPGLPIGLESCHQVHTQSFIIRPDGQWRINFTQERSGLHPQLLGGEL